MFYVSEDYKQTVRGAHTIRTRVDLMRDGKVTHPNIPFIDGEVEVSASSVVRRSLRLTLPPKFKDGPDSELFTSPYDPAHPLSHYGQAIRVRKGVEYPDGTAEWVPMGIFRIDGHRDASLLDASAVQIEGVSYESYVQDARFPTARSVSSPSCVTLIRDLILEVLPKAKVRIATTFDRRVPRTTFERDRWEAIETLAASIGCDVYCDGDGVFTIKDSTTVNDKPVWTFKPGPGGTLVSAGSQGSRDGVYNAIVVTNDNAVTDVEPVYYMAVDDNPSSPTRYGDPENGAYGMVPMFMEIPTLTSQSQAYRAAHANLAKHLGASETFDLTSVPFDPLEAGDLVTIQRDPEAHPNDIRVHIVDNIQIPLVAGGDFRLATRDVRAVG